MLVFSPGYCFSGTMRVPVTISWLHECCFFFFDPVAGEFSGFLRPVLTSVHKVSVQHGHHGQGPKEANNAKTTLVEVVTSIRG